LVFQKESITVKYTYFCMFSNKKLKIHPFFRYFELYSTLLPEKDKIPDEPGRG